MRTWPRFIPIDRPKGPCKVAAAFPQPRCMPRGFVDTHFYPFQRRRATPRGAADPVGVPALRVLTPGDAGNYRLETSLGNRRFEHGAGIHCPGPADGVIVARHVAAFVAAVEH